MEVMTFRFYFSDTSRLLEGFFMTSFNADFNQKAKIKHTRQNTEAFFMGLLGQTQTQTKQCICNLPHCFWWDLEMFTYFTNWNWWTRNVSSRPDQMHIWLQPHASSHVDHKQAPQHLNLRNRTTVLPNSHGTSLDHIWLDKVNMSN